MTSREKIKSIKSLINEFYHTEKCEGRLTECANDCWKSYQKDCDEIEQKLDRLEHLEKENKELRKAVKSWNENGGKLLRENTKLKKALEKACERMDYTCPVEEELIEDLNCEECESNCKECWVKFFLKGALKNE